MLILAFESSARPASVALLEDGRLLSQYSQCSQLTHSRTLLPMAEDMLKNTELSLDDVDLFAVAHGPGSFTGVRIGLAAARGMALALQIPVHGATTLQAMVQQTNGKVMAVLDTKRGDFYTQIFQDAEPLEAHQRSEHRDED